MSRRIGTGSHRELCGLAVCCYLSLPWFSNLCPFLDAVRDVSVHRPHCPLRRAACWGRNAFHTRTLGGQHQEMPNSTALPSGAQYIGDTRCAVLCHPGFYPRLVSTGPGTLSDDSSSDGRSPYAQSLRLPHRMGFQVYLQVNFCPLWLLSTSPMGVSSGSHPHLQDGCCPVRGTRWLLLQLHTSWLPLRHHPKGLQNGMPVRPPCSETSVTPPARKLPRHGA